MDRDAVLDAMREEGLVDDGTPRPDGDESLVENVEDLAIDEPEPEIFKSAKQLRQEELLDNLESVPESYSGRSMKEDLVLEYVNMFHHEYEQLLPGRQPLMLTPANECSVRKFVSTFLRPTELPYPELYDVATTAKFVSDYISYEPLDNPTLLPEYVQSPTFTLTHQAGDSFDMSILLASFLISAGYDAYCVSGFAHKLTTLNDQTNKACSVITEKKPKLVAQKDERQTRYTIKKRAVLESEFQRKQLEKIAQQAAAASSSVHGSPAGPGFSADGPLPVDDMPGQRRHAWVLVLSGKRDISEPFFIEPSTGEIHKPSSPYYHSIESVWNERNVWVNMQNTSKPLSDLAFQLDDLRDWECIFLEDSPDQAGDDDASGAVSALDRERMERQRMQKESVQSGEAGDNILDLPPSWVSRLWIDMAAFQSRYPGQYKRILFKDCLVELFAPYSQPDGVVKRLTWYSDPDRTSVRKIDSMFENRKDKLRRRKILPTEGLKHDFFDPGRRRDQFMEALKEHIEVKGKRVELHFYSEARDDGLVKRVELYDETMPASSPFSLRKVMEFYSRAHDHLIYRSVSYDTEANRQPAQPLGPPIIVRTVGGAEFDISSSSSASSDVRKLPDRMIRKMAEKFSRDETKPAEKDVAKRIFSETDYRLEYHFSPDHITRSSTVYRKDGNSSITCVDSFAKPPKKAELLEEFQRLTLAERECANSIKEAERLSLEVLDSRKTEEILASKPTKPEASAFWTVSVYDVVRNKPQQDALNEARRRAEEQAKAKSRKDYLTPFLPPAYAAAANAALESGPNARLPELPADVALAAYESCLRALKERLIARASIIQSRLDEEKAALAKKQAGFQKNADVMDSMEEKEHIRYCEEAMFRIHILEQRLDSHEKSSFISYRELQNKLRSDPRLARWLPSAGGDAHHSEQTQGRRRH